MRLRLAGLVLFAGCRSDCEVPESHVDGVVYQLDYPIYGLTGTIRTESEAVIVEYTRADDGTEWTVVYEIGTLIQ